MKPGSAKWPVRVAMLLLLAMLLGCGGGELDARLENYRIALEERLGGGVSPGNTTVAAGELRLPRRRERRLAVHDVRMGPFDFLATIGCSLSEIVAQRNSALGRVLVPTRRLAHELAVIDAMNDCLPALSPVRAKRLASKLEIKKADLARHRWNAVWLDEDLERYLSFGPASLIGGADSRDGAAQLMRAARALGEDDVLGLESAFSQLRDDVAIGTTLALMGRVTSEFERIAGLLRQHGVSRCDAEERHLAQIFQKHFLPLQIELGDLNRTGMDFVDAFDALYAVSVQGVEVSDPMRIFKDIVSGGIASPGIGERFANSMRAHATAWAPVLEECGVIPRP